MLPRRLLFVLLASLALMGPILLAMASPAAAQDNVLRGTVRVSPRETLEGAIITVYEADGTTEIETVTTDVDGKWSVDIAGAGDYVVVLDVTTLPDDVGFKEGFNEIVNVTVDERGSKSVAFQIEKGGAKPTIEIDPTWQRLVNRGVTGIKVGLLVAMASVGLSLIYGVTGLVNFAHSEMVTFGAVVGFGMVSAWRGLPLVIPILVAIAIGGALGLLLEGGLFRPLRKRKMNNISLMVVSIGLAFVMRYLILIYFGTEPEQFPVYRQQLARDYGPISLPPKDVVIMALAVGMLVLVGLLLQRTKLGTAMRAVSDNPALAESSGINVDTTILAVWIAGSALAAMGGIMLGMTQVVEWQMGEKMLLLIFAAVTLGGLGTAYGAMVGGLIIGFASEFSTYWLDADLKFLIALVVLILVLLFRPQGVLGVKERFG